MCSSHSPACVSGPTRDGRAECFRDPSKCQACPFCSFPGNTCTNVQSTNGSFITLERTSQFTMALQLLAPTKLDHNDEWEVETPVPVCNSACLIAAR